MSWVATSEGGVSAPSAPPELDGIDDEEVLKQMWQRAEDFGERRRIRARMYKLREQRLREMVQNDEESLGALITADGEDQIKEKSEIEMSVNNQQSASPRRSSNIEVTMRMTGHSAVTDNVSLQNVRLGGITMRGVTSDSGQRSPSDEEIIDERIKEVSKERTDRYKTILDEYDRKGNDDDAVVSLTKSTYSISSDALAGDSYQSMKHKEVRDSASPTRYDRRPAAYDSEGRFTSDEECSFMKDSDVVTDVLGPSRKNGRAEKSIGAPVSSKKMLSSDSESSSSRPSSTSPTRRNQGVTTNNRVSAARRGATSPTKSTTTTKRGTASRATSTRKSKLTDIANQIDSSLTKEYKQLDSYLCGTVDPDDEIIMEEEEEAEDSSGTVVKMVVQTRRKKDGTECTTRRLARSTKIVDKESDIDEILIGNPDHEVLNRNVEEEVDKDGSKIKIITEVRRRPDGIEYTTKNVLKTSKIFDYDHPEDVSYCENDELIESAESEETDEKGITIRTVTETRRKCDGTEYTTKKVYRTSKTTSRITPSEDDEVLDTQESEETQEDGTVVKTIIEKRRTKTGEEYTHRQVFRTRRMTLSGIELQKGLPMINNDDKILSKKEKEEYDGAGKKVKIVTETRRRTDGSTYSFDYVLRSFKATEKDLKKMPVRSTNASNIVVSSEDKLVKEDVKEELQEDGSTIKTIVERRKAKDGNQYLRHRIMKIPKLPEPELQVGSLDDEIIDGNVNEKVLEDGTRCRAITERRRSSASGLQYTLKRMSKVFQHSLQHVGADEIFDENVTEEETSDGIIVKTIIRRYQRPDETVYTTHDIHKIYTNPVSVTIDESEDDKLVDKSYDERETNDGFLIKTIMETRCRSDGLHYTVERVERVSKLSSDLEVSYRGTSLSMGGPGDTIVSREEHEEPAENGVVLKTILEIRRRMDGTEYTNKTTIRSTQVLVPEHETSYVVIKPDDKSGKDDNRFMPSLDDKIIYTREKEEIDEKGNTIIVIIETRESKSTGEKYNLTKKVHTTDVLVTDQGEKVLAKKSQMSPKSTPKSKKATEIPYGSVSALKNKFSTPKGKDSAGTKVSVDRTNTASKKMFFEEAANRSAAVTKKQTKAGTRKDTTSHEVETEIAKKGVKEENSSKSLSTKKSDSIKTINTTVPSKSRRISPEPRKKSNEQSKKVHNSFSPKPNSPESSSDEKRKSPREPRSAVTPSLKRGSSTRGSPTSDKQKPLFTYKKSSARVEHSPVRSREGTPSGGRQCCRRLNEAMELQAAQPKSRGSFTRKPMPKKDITHSTNDDTKKKTERPQRTYEKPLFKTPIKKNAPEPEQQGKPHSKEYKKPKFNSLDLPKEPIVSLPQTPMTEEARSSMGNLDSPLIEDVTQDTNLSSYSIHRPSIVREPSDYSSPEEVKGSSSPLSRSSSEPVKASSKKEPFKSKGSSPDKKSPRKKSSDKPLFEKAPTLSNDYSLPTPTKDHTTFKHSGKVKTSSSSPTTSDEDKKYTSKKRYERKLSGKISPDTHLERRMSGERRKSPPAIKDARNLADRVEESTERTHRRLCCDRIASERAEDSTLTSLKKKETTKDSTTRKLSDWEKAVFSQIIPDEPENKTYSKTDTRTDTTRRSSTESKNTVSLKKSLIERRTEGKENQRTAIASDADKSSTKRVPVVEPLCVKRKSYKLGSDDEAEGERSVDSLMDDVNLTSTKLVMKTMSPEPRKYDIQQRKSSFGQDSRSSLSPTRGRSTSPQSKHSPFSRSKETSPFSKEDSPSRFVTGKPVDQGVNPNKIKKLERIGSSKKFYEDFEVSTAEFSTYIEQIETITDITILEKLLVKAETYEERRIIRGKIRSLRKPLSTQPAPATHDQFITPRYPLSSPLITRKTPQQASSSISVSKMGERSAKSASSVEDNFLKRRSQQTSKESSYRESKRPSPDREPAKTPKKPCPLSSESTIEESRVDMVTQKNLKNKQFHESVSESKKSSSQWTSRKTSVDKSTARDLFVEKEPKKSQHGSTEKASRKSSTEKEALKESQTRKTSTESRKSSMGRKSSAETVTTTVTKTSRRVSTEKKTSSYEEMKSSSDCEITKESKVTSNVKGRRPVRKTSVELEQERKSKSRIARSKVESTFSSEESEKGKRSTVSKEDTFKTDSKRVSHDRKMSPPAVKGKRASDSSYVEPLRHQRVTAATVSQKQTDVEKIISPYGVGPTDENGVPLIGLKALKKRRQTQDGAPKPVEPNENDFQPSDAKGRPLFGLKAIRKSPPESTAYTATHVATETAAVDQMMKSASLVTEKKNLTTGTVTQQKTYATSQEESSEVVGGIRNYAKEEASAEVAEEGDEDAVKAVNLKDIIRLHESKVAEADVRSPTAAQTPKQKLRDAFEPTVETTESRTHRTWDLETDLSTRSEVVENIIAKHETLSQQDSMADKSEKKLTGILKKTSTTSAPPAKVSGDITSTETETEKRERKTSSAEIVLRSSKSPEKEVPKERTKTPERKTSYTEIVLSPTTVPEGDEAKKSPKTNKKYSTKTKESKKSSSKSSEQSCEISSSDIGNEDKKRKKKTSQKDKTKTKEIGRKEKRREGERKRDKKSLIMKETSHDVTKSSNVADRAQQNVKIIKTRKSTPDQILATPKTSKIKSTSRERKSSHRSKVLNVEKQSYKRQSGEDQKSSPKISRKATFSKHRVVVKRSANERKQVNTHAVTSSQIEQLELHKKIQSDNTELDVAGIRKKRSSPVKRLVTPVSKTREKMAHLHAKDTNRKMLSDNRSERSSVTKHKGERSVTKKRSVTPEVESKRESPHRNLRPCQGAIRTEVIRTKNEKRFKSKKSLEKTEKIITDVTLKEQKETLVKKKTERQSISSILSDKESKTEEKAPKSRKMKENSPFTEKSQKKNLIDGAPISKTETKSPRSETIKELPTSSPELEEFRRTEDQISTLESKKASNVQEETRQIETRQNLDEIQFEMKEELVVSESTVAEKQTVDSDEIKTVKIKAKHREGSSTLVGEREKDTTIKTSGKKSVDAESRASAEVEDIQKVKSKKICKQDLGSSRIQTTEQVSSRRESESKNDDQRCITSKHTRQHEQLETKVTSGKDITKRSEQDTLHKQDVQRRKTNTENTIQYDSSRDEKRTHEEVDDIKLLKKPLREKQPFITDVREKELDIRKRRLSDRNSLLSQENRESIENTSTTEDRDIKYSFDSQTATKRSRKISQKRKSSIETMENISDAILKSKQTRTYSLQSLSGVSTTSSVPSYMRPRGEGPSKRHSTPERNPQELEDLLLNSHQYTRCTKMKMPKPPVTYDYVYAVNPGDVAAGGGGPGSYSIYFGPRNRAPVKEDITKKLSTDYSVVTESKGSKENRYDSDKRFHFSDTSFKHDVVNTDEDLARYIKKGEVENIEISKSQEDSAENTYENIIRRYSDAQGALDITRKNDKRPLYPIYSSVEVYTDESPKKEDAFPEIRQQYLDTVRSIDKYSRENLKTDVSTSKQSHLEYYDDKFEVTKEEASFEKRDFVDAESIQTEEIGESNVLENISADFIDVQNTSELIEPGGSLNKEEMQHTATKSNEFLTDQTSSLAAVLQSNKAASTAFKDMEIFSKYSKDDLQQKYNFQVETQMANYFKSDLNKKTDDREQDVCSQAIESNNARMDNDNKRFLRDYDYNKIYADKIGKQSKAHRDDSEFVEKSIYESKEESRFESKKETRSFSTTTHGYTSDDSHFVTFDGRVVPSRQPPMEYLVMEPAHEDRSSANIERRSSATLAGDLGQSFATVQRSSSGRRIKGYESVDPFYQDQLVQTTSLEKDQGDMPDGKSFLDDHSKVSGITDVLHRMGATEAVDHESRVTSDDQARSLLNKFLGAQVLMSGVESMMANSSADSSQGEVRVTREVTSDSSKSVTRNGHTTEHHSHFSRGPETYTMKTSSNASATQQSDSPIVKGVNIEEVTDTFELNQLLDSCEEYDERRRVRLRLKTLMANPNILEEELKGHGSSHSSSRRVGGSSRAANLGSLSSEGIQNKTGRATSAHGKGSSPFDKFKQLDSQLPKHTTRE